MSALLANPQSVPIALNSPRYRGRTTTHSAHGEGERAEPRPHDSIPSARGSAHLSDEELLIRYRDAGRASDFNELVRRYSGPLHRYLTRFLGCGALADDVLQNTFFQVHAKCRLYEEGRSMRRWLYAIAMHNAVDALRRAGRHTTVSIDGPDEQTAPIDLLAVADPSPLERLQREERGVRLRACIDRLPESQRRTLTLVYDQGLKQDEIAALLGIPLGTVKSRVRGALSRLREMAGPMHLVDAG